MPQSNLEGQRCARAHHSRPGAQPGLPRCMRSEGLNYSGCRTAEMVRAVSVRAGNWPVTAAGAAGVSERTFFRWLAWFVTSRSLTR